MSKTNREWLYSLDPIDLSEWFDAEHVSGNERGCEHCEKGAMMYPRVADGEYDYIEAFIENSDLIVEIGNYDVVFKIEACPMCGRRL
jgi:ribosomal protein S27AE